MKLRSPRCGPPDVPLSALPPPRDRQAVRNRLRRARVTLIVMAGVIGRILDMDDPREERMCLKGLTGRIDGSP